MEEMLLVAAIIGGVAWWMHSGTTPAQSQPAPAAATAPAQPTPPQPIPAAPAAPAAPAPATAK